MTGWFGAMGRVVLAGTAAAGLVACSSVREELGVGKNPPDEFAVVTKAPLVMPPDYTLRPPQPGAPESRAPSPSQQARQALIPGAGDGAETQGQVALLERAGAPAAEADIRAKVDGDNRELTEKNQNFAARLLGRTPTDPTAETIDAKAEQERLKQEGVIGGPPVATPVAVPAPEAPPAASPPPEPVKAEGGGLFDWLF